MNNSLKQTTVLSLNVEEAIQSFKECEFGYNQELALLEADRCLQCKHQPCVNSCPIHVPIPQFISMIKEDNLEEAYRLITSRNNFPDFCSRVCHVEHQCESTCVRAIKGEPVGINHLERYVADRMSHTPLTKQGSLHKKVCVVGAGPSGLACASDLAQLGYEVSVYDRENKAGGMVFYGVPKYRLPYKWIELEVNKLKDIGVTFHFNKAFGNNLDLDYLRQNYEAVYIAIGEEEMMTLNIEGDHLPQVYTSAQYLKLVTTDHMETISNFKKVVVIGGGNTSMDCARSALRLGAEVLVSYRRRQEDMPASKKEVEDAKKEGVKFMFLTSPIKIIGSSYVEAIELVNREVIGDAGQQRQETQIVEDSNFIVEADCIIAALGSKPNRMLRTKHLNLDIDYKGLVVTNSDFETSEEGVFAGGDMVLGADTVVRAIDTGKKAAKSIHKKLSNV